MVWLEGTAARKAAGTPDDSPLQRRATLRAPIPAPSSTSPAIARSVISTRYEIQSPRSTGSLPWAVEQVNNTGRARANPPATWKTLRGAVWNRYHPAASAAASRAAQPAGVAICPAQPGRLAGAATSLATGRTSRKAPAATESVVWMPNSGLVRIVRSRRA